MGKRHIPLLMGYPRKGSFGDLWWILGKGSFGDLWRILGKGPLGDLWWILGKGPLGDLWWILGKGSFGDLWWILGKDLSAIFGGSSEEIFRRSLADPRKRSFGDLWRILGRDLSAILKWILGKGYFLCFYVSPLRLRMTLFQESLSEKMDRVHATKPRGVSYTFLC